MNSGGFLHALCGWQLLSDVHLPELPAWQGADPAERVEFRIGAVPPSLGDTVLKIGPVEVDGARALMDVANVGTYLIENGNRIVFAPEPGMRPDAPDVRLFLLGGALGYLCHQRGVLPIHASAVEIDGRAVLFTGISGAGKSTLADAFLRNGHRMLSDDVAPIELTGGSARILPSIARIRLWPDSAEHAGWPVGELERCRSSLLKVTRPIGAADMTGALEPWAVFHLQPGRTDEPGLNVTQISGVRAMTALATRVYRERGLMATVGRAAGIARVAEISSRIPHHFRMERRVDYANLPATLDGVLATLRAVR